MKNISKASLIIVGTSLFLLSSIIPSEVQAVSSSMSITQQSNSLNAISSSTSNVSNGTSLSVTMTINGQNVNELKNKFNAIINNTQIITPQQKTQLTNIIDQQISLNAQSTNTTISPHGCVDVGAAAIQVCW